MDAGLEIIPVLNKIDLPGRGAGAAGPGDHGSHRRQAGGDPGRLGQGGHRRAGAARGDRRPGSAAPRACGCAAPRARSSTRYYDRYRGAIPSIRVVDGVVRKGMEIALRRPPRRGLPRGRGGLSPAGPAARPTSWRPARWATWSPACATCATPGWATPSSTPPTAPTELLPGYRDVKSMVFAGLYPDRLRPVRGAARRAGEAPAQRRQPALRARVVHRAGLRLPLRLPRPAAHGDRAGAAGAGVRSRPDHHGADGGVPRLHAPTARCSCVENPSHLPDPASIARIEEPFVKARIMAPAEYIGGIMKLGQDRRGVYHGMHYLDTSPGRVRLGVPAGRDRARFLRQAQVAQPGLRLARLRDGRATASPTW